jgi:hypothetical protein
MRRDGTRGGRDGGGRAAGTATASLGDAVDEAVVSGRGGRDGDER